MSVVSVCRVSVWPPLDLSPPGSSLHHDHGFSPVGQNTLQQFATLYNTLKHFTAPNNTLQHFTALYNTLQSFTTLYTTFTALDNTLQHFTTLYNTLQNTLHFLLSHLTIQCITIQCKHGLHLNLLHNLEG